MNGTTSVLSPAADTVRLDDLKHLLTTAADPCVSLFLPTFRSGPDTQQNPIRLKQLAQKARVRLAERGLPEEQVDTLLQPIADLLSDVEFWHHPADGLALYLAPDSFRCFRVALPLRERVTVGSRFLVRPLLPLLSLEGHFFILAVSINHVRLLEASRDGVWPMDLDGIPTSMEEALGRTTYNSDLQVHISGPAGQGHRSGTVHGHGDADEEHFKEDLVQYFRRVGAACNLILSGRREPLLLAAVESYFPLFRRACHDPRLLTQGVHGSPDGLSDAELRDRAWKIIEPWWRQEIEAEASRFRELRGSGRSITGADEILAAAQQGRVEVLLLDPESEIWGTFEADFSRTVIHAGPEPGDDDLLDRAAALTLQQGGRVYTMPTTALPEGAGAAAILRY